MMKNYILYLIMMLIHVSVFSQHLKSKSNQKPNIILILADDLGYETLTCNGGESYMTPNLDKMATRGVRFTNCYASPLCSPSRVKIMTGKYNFRNYEKFGYLNPAEITFGNLLKKSGYKTAIAGKWQLGGDVATPNLFGFDEYCLWQLYEGDFWYRYKSPRIWKNGEKLNNEALKDHYGPDVFTQFVTDFIDQNKSEPFFIYYPMCLVHDPFQPTPNQEDFNNYKIEGLNDTTYFRNMVQYMDRCVGKIQRHIDSLNLSDNTIILFTGDNGTDRDVVSLFQGNRIRGDKGYTTNAGTHVPLLVSGGAVPKSQINRELVDFSDILPTLMDMANTNLPDDFVTDGKSFFPQLLDDNYSAREWIFCDYDPKGREFPIRRYVQNKAYKLYHSGEFYNFHKDEQEKNPLLPYRLNDDERINYNELKRALTKMNLAVSQSKK